ncbi:MAG: TIGR04086 family membrane protein [Oscillospiraceae bacterium]|nr:TIGR04086 family membrane protein [Oscillospiraceae bacterium]
MKRRSNASGSLILKIAAVSALSGTAVFFSLSAVFAFIFFLADTPYHIYRLASELTVAAGSFAAGRTGGFCNRENGIVTGALCSMLVFIPAFILFIVFSGKPFMPVFIMTFAISAVSGAAGGVYGVNRHIAGRPFVYKGNDENV